MSDEHMWLIPFTEGQDHLLTIDLGRVNSLVGVRVWNYNKSTDDSFRGVSEISVIPGGLGLNIKALSTVSRYILKQRFHSENASEGIFTELYKEFKFSRHFAMARDAVVRWQTRQMKFSMVLSDNDLSCLNCSL